MDGRFFHPFQLPFYYTPEERVHYLLSAADSDATAALVYLAEALEVCVASGLHEMEATVHYQLACCHIQGANPVAALKQADLSIECVPQFSDAYVIKGDAHKVMGDSRLLHYLDEKHFFSRAIENYCNGYKHSMPKSPLSICKAVIVAVDHGLQSALLLQEKLPSKECTAVVNCLAADSLLDWNSQHMKYLVMKTAVPGSGIAITLSCDLSAFYWKILFRKLDFDCDIMHAILSLGAKIGTGDLRSIVRTVADSNTEILILALDNSPDITSLNSLGMEALNLKKFCFLETLILHGATVYASSSKKMTFHEILQNKRIFSHVNSTPEGHNELMISALKNGDIGILEDCKTLLQSCKNQLNLSNLVKHSIQGSTDTKKKCFEFIRWLLESKLVNSNGLDGQKCPLDAVLELSKEYAADKLELLCLLLQNGANIQHCTFPKGKQTTFLHIATQFAIEQCNTNLLEVACKHYPFDEVLDLTDKENNTPYHLAMERRCSPTTIKICEILSHYPINPILTNIHNRKPGEKKHGARDKRASDKRYPILEVASKQFQQQMKKKTGSTKKKVQKGLSPTYPEINISTTLLVTKLDVDDKRSSATITSVSLTTDQVLISVQDMLVTLSRKPAPYFEPPPDYNRQGSSTQPSAQVPRQEISDTSLQDTTRESLFDTNVEETVKSCVEEDVDAVCKQFEGCPWEVECTDRVKKFLTDTKVPRKWKEAVLKKVQQIADGIPFHNRNLCGNLRSIFKLYETKFLKGGRIIWEIAIQFSSRLTGNSSTGLGTHQKGYIYSEVIRLWDIVPDHDNLNRSIDRVVENITKSKLRGKSASKLIPLAILQNCKKPCTKGQEKLKFPKYYTLGDTEPELLAEEDQSRPTFIPAGSTRDDEHNVITFYSFDNSFVKSMLDGDDVRRDFPFKEWPKEHDIINMPQGKVSILLLGRSGTGKTTCCLYRLWNQFHNYWSRAQDAGPLMQCQPLSILQNRVILNTKEAAANDDKDDKNIEACTLFSESLSSDKDDQQKYPDHVHFHQVFITKNYVLCSQMKKKFYDLAAGRNLGNEHMQFEEADVPPSLLDINDYAYPLFLTARQFFVLLDNSLGDGLNFFPRDDTGKLREKIVSLDYDHEDPNTLLDLEDSDSDEEYDDDDEGDKSSRKPPSTSKAKLPERVEVTATYFTDKIWPKISKTVSLKNVKLDPLLIWMEIKSFIKGSLHALENKEGHLSEEEYESLGKKLASNYADQREDIYKIFKLYVNYMKHQSKENVFDECDLNNSIYSRLNSLIDLPWYIHSFYIDEVQDFTQAELAILLRICRNPNDLFLTGDTAQSIMRGISFRFSELKYLFYCAKEKASKTIYKVPAIVVPQVKDLRINFRSHTGVLKLAASVIDLMKKFFPSSFDCLPGDEGMFPGPTPIVLDSCNISDLAVVLRMNKRESSAIEFGAHQVIIVHSEEAKNNIPDILKTGIVLTVFESKGLEFDDVLLYDFFKYSQVKNEWRVVTTYIDAEENRHLVKTEGDTCVLGNPRKLNFDESHHKSLNPELKYLYTAITRAKCNLWIYDSDESKRLPMFDFWNKQGLVKVIKVSDVTDKDQATLFSATSTSEEWKSQGDYFKKKNLWEPAMKCYHRAHCLHLELEANAYSLVQQARKLTVKSHEIEELYLRAAHAFLECDKLQNKYQCLDNAAKCLKNAKKYNEAAKLFIQLEQNDKAFKCFKKSNDFTVLADIKEKMGDYNGAIRILLKHGCIMEALKCAAEHESHVSECYHKGQIAHKYAHDLLETIKLDDQISVKLFQTVLEYLPALEQVQFLKTAQMHDKVCEILEHEKKFNDAYRVYKAQGWFEEGLALAIRQNNKDEQAAFLLFKAAKEMAIEGRLLRNTMETLKKMMEFNTEAMLVYGMAVQDYTKMRNVVTHYHEKKNSFAHVEALSIAVAKAEYDRDFHKWKNIHLVKDEDLATVLLNECRNIQFIKTALIPMEKIDPPQIIHHMESFYGFEKDQIDDDVYLIPESSYYWTNQLLKGLNMDSIDRDPDGLLKLEAHLVLQAVLDRYEAFTKSWIAEDKFKAMDVLCMSLNRFSFHQQIINHGGHLKESGLTKLDKTSHLQAYLNILSSVFEMKELGSTQVPFDVVEVVSNATSPQATCYIQIPTLDMKHRPYRTYRWQVPKLEIVSEELIQALNRKSLVVLNSSDNAFKFDDWVELWRIKCMTNGCDEMKNVLIKRTRELNKRARTEWLPNIPLVYVFNRHENIHQHLILVWLHTCDQLKKDKVLSACTVLVHSVVRHIASHKVIWETISVSNLLSILTVHTTAILTMLAICDTRNGMPGNIYIPSSYKNVIKVFLSMLGKKSLLDSCHYDITRRQGEELRLFPDKLLNLLDMIMESLIGIQNVHFNPLNYAVSNERCLQNHEAEQFLIFVLTVFGHLGLYTSDNELLRSYRLQICCSIEHCPLPVVNAAYELFSTCATISGCFGAVRILLMDSKDSLRHFDVWSNQDNEAQLMKMFQRRLLPISENISKVNKAVEIKKFKFRPSVEPFIPSWMSGETPTTTSITHHEPEIELGGDHVIPPLDQESVPDRGVTMMAEDHLMVNKEFCSICACPLRDDTAPVEEHPNSTSQETAEIQQFSEHCHSDQHLINKDFYDKFESEVRNYHNPRKMQLSELAKRCHIQQKTSWQDHELINVNENITEVLTEFKKTCGTIRDSAEWREGITCMNNIHGKMEHLIRKAERQLEKSKEKKLELEKEEEEEGRKEEKENEDIEEWEEKDEHIPNTELDSGQMDKRNKRKIKSQRKRNKRK